MLGAMLLSLNNLNICGRNFRPQFKYLALVQHKLDTALTAPHVLCMASIYYCDGVAIYRVGKVPLIGISHVVASPLGDGRLAAEEGALYLKHGVIGVMHVLLHQLLRIGMLIFLGHIAIEGCYLLCATFPNNMLHNFAYSSLTAANVISRASSIVIVS